ncbi:hypothetical protein B7494_g8073 [Chlorociboria aeruginascens]|nr:hypothetical protein B7494_g8073 [Chlorociboria aeruginascens]
MEAPSLLVIVFLVQLAIHIVNTVGASTINDLLWYLYNIFPTPTSKGAAEQRQLKAKFLRIRAELNATSSQDEFAKWAKLRRQHDKVLEQYEKIKSDLNSTKSTFDRTVSALRWLGTTGVRTLLQFWCSKQAMFWIPKGWVPYYAEWLLSFPRAPIGSISINAWFIACAAMILLVSDAIVGVVGLVMVDGLAQMPKGKGDPMKMPSEKSGQDTSEEKKEL